MSTETPTAILTTTIARLEASARRNLETMEEAIKIQEAAPNEAAREAASMIFHAAILDHVTAADAALEVRKLLATLSA